MNIILETALLSAVLGLLIGVALGFFHERFAVPTDPLVDQVRAILPGANCGACGFAGCDAYAVAVAHQKTTPDRCTTGGKKAGDQIAALLGLNSTAVDQIAVLVCQGSNAKAAFKGEYAGTQTCRAAKITAGGTKLCQWSCIGLGDCTRVCPFDALHMGEDGLPHVDVAKCTGCGKCVDICPQSVLIKVPRAAKGAIPLCSNRNPVKSKVIGTCKTGCIKCEICVKECPEHAIRMERGLPVVDQNLCTSCGICVDKCPTKVFKLIEKDIMVS
ncbi:MAG TPA: RnfABCDGE type electron transport complex subunit B [Candidatus Cryosericum sp.]|jgi:Na+-translocating ferredoxin:NAD+ oxidoreductase RNF subunit RnfB|nr:RnfABCDGE type electron transport complex subunit B [Candidatus Cryosericum sp.]